MGDHPRRYQPRKEFYCRICFRCGFENKEKNKPLTLEDFKV